MTHTNSYRVLTLALGLLFAFVALVWTQAPADAQEPETGEPSLSIQIIPETDGIGIAATGAEPMFNVGETFRVSVVALGVEDPGVFGGQFTIQYDTTFLNAVEGSLVAGSAIQPVVNPVNEIDVENGLIKFAASRQGDLDNLTGDVVLASLSFEAVAATEPQTTTIDLENVKLGSKGGIAVPVSGIVDLDVIIKGDNGSEPGPGDITGSATVQGRDADNQAGHLITATGVQTGTTPLTATTTVTGSFFIDNAPADTYSVTADSAGFLAATCEGVVHTAEILTDLVPVDLLAGDIDGDGIIDITDAVAIGNAFGSTETGEVADLNVDGEVDILDLILMAANYGQTSVDNPWVCELAAEL